MSDMNSEMVANLDWVNATPDGENNYTMACPFPLEGEPSSTGNAAGPAVAMAVLICRHNSHPFQKRTLLLHQPVKVGRSVAKTKADINNAIFDCKVLSRHHASLWYDKGHFYLADTKSSNGTFVNSHRLSEGSKESAPYEVCSGDIVQFGVDVMENSGSVTHGCIVATLKLYLPDGNEAKASSNMSIQSMPLDDLHILNKIIQEAVDREYMLEEKLSSLRQAVESCQNAADASWRAQVCEDHLLCRVHFLEKRLATTTGNTPPNEIQQLLEDKHKYELSAKESLRLAHEERLKLMNQVCNLQWSLCSSEDECTALRNSTDRAHEEYQKLSSKYSTLELQLKTAQKALEDAEHKLQKEKFRVKDLIAEHDRQVKKLKLENDKHTVVDCGIDDLIDSEKNSLIIDNKTWEKGDFKESSLPEAIRGLPDYLKAILPDQVLQKVGCKSLRSSSLVNELKVKLIYLNKELCNLENKRTADETNENSNNHSVSNNSDESISNNDTSLEIKTIPLNSSTCNDICLENSNAKQSNENECNETVDVTSEEKEIENHKETYENSNNLEKPEKDLSNDEDLRLHLIDEIKKISEQLEQAREEGPMEKIIFLQDELSNSLSKISSLRNELKALQSSLTHSHNKIIELNQDKEQLISDKKMLEMEASEKSEYCRSLELQLTCWKEKKKNEEAFSINYKEIASELQNQLSRALESEANCRQELKESNLKLFELQRQLDVRPQLVDVDSLRLKIEKLEKEMETKEDHIKDLLSNVEILKQSKIVLEEKVSTQDSMPFECTECKSRANELVESPDDETDLSPNQHNMGHIMISSSMSAENLMLNHNQDILSKESSPFSSISVNLKRLTELEEELVVTKEKWAHVSEERSQLASELEIMTEKNKQLYRRSFMNTMAFVIPLLAIFYYILTKHQSIS